MRLPRKYVELKEKYGYAMNFEQKFFDIQDEEDQPDFYKRLLNGTGNITKTDIKIAWFLKEHPEYLGGSAREIGRNCDVDGRSVSYLLRKLEYKNPFEFKKLNRIAKKS